MLSLRKRRQHPRKRFSLGANKTPFVKLIHTSSHSIRSVGSATHCTPPALAAGRAAPPSLPPHSLASGAASGRISGFCDPVLDIFEVNLSLLKGHTFEDLKKNIACFKTLNFISFEHCCVKWESAVRACWPLSVVRVMTRREWCCG